MRIQIPVPSATQLITLVLSLCVLLPDVRSLQCYNCRGITNYDPSSCFQPNYERTIRQECQKGEVCEQRIHRVDRLQEVVERGCTSNCDGRTYIWNDDFRVHCCDGNNLCNVGNVSSISVLSLLFCYLLYKVL